MTHGVIKAYSGYLRNEDFLVKSASGGVAYAFESKFILQGGVVYSVQYSSDFRIGEWARAEYIEELSAFQGSKYVESRKVYDGFNLYEKISHDLSEGLNVLAVGLPCDIGAIKAFLKKDYSNLYCVDLICHGPTTRKVSEDYLNKLEKKFKSRICDFSVRYKKDGQWTPPYLRAVFENGKVFMKPFYETDYGIAFSIMARSSCYNCQFKGSSHRSDITIGDYWGLKPENKIEWNDKGVSIAFARTGKGLQLIESIKDICVVNETDAEFAMSHNKLISEQKEKNPKYDKFVQNLERFGLHKAVKLSRTTSERAIICLRKVIKAILPDSVIYLIKHWI